MFPIFSKHFLPPPVALAFVSSNIKRTSKRIDWPKLIEKCLAHDPEGCVNQLDIATGGSIGRDPELRLALILSINRYFQDLRRTGPPRTFTLCKSQLKNENENGDLIEMYMGVRLVAIDIKDEIVKIIDKFTTATDKFKDPDHLFDPPSNKYVVSEVLSKPYVLTKNGKEIFVGGWVNCISKALRIATDNDTLTSGIVAPYIDQPIPAARKAWQFIYDQKVPTGEQS